jgi:hypothetical protein
MAGSILRKIKNKLKFSKTYSNFRAKQRDYVRRLLKDDFQPIKMEPGTKQIWVPTYPAGGLMPVRSVETKDQLWIAFYPTGGYGDGIISAKLFDELMTLAPVRIDVYVNNLAFGEAVYGQRPNVRIYHVDAFHQHYEMYDLVLTVEHFVHVEHFDPLHMNEAGKALLPYIRKLGEAMLLVRPDIEQQWYREGMHFRRCELNDVNRYTELNMGNVFHIKDQLVSVYPDVKYYQAYKDLNLGDKYITLNFGTDVMHHAGIQTKEWPLKHFEGFVKLFREKYPDYKIYQTGGPKSTVIEGVDGTIFGKSLEIIKWVMKNSTLHVDCEGGMVHMASQLFTKCLVVFGPTPAHMYAYPWNINIVPEVCSNCMGVHKEWAYECYKGFDEPPCTNSITPEIAMGHIKFYMEQGKPKRELNADEVRNVDTEELESELSRIIDSADEVKVILFVNPGQSDMPAKARKLGYKVCTVDPTYGWNGNMLDVSYSSYTGKNIKLGIDSRFGNIYNIPFSGYTFDYVILMNEPENGIKDQYDISRVLRANGKLICVK